MTAGTIQINASAQPDANEWLLTNGIGGFAMAAVAGPNRRRYHGWLVAAARPPVGRILALQGMVDHLAIGDAGHVLTCNEFDDPPQLHPAGALMPDEFELVMPGQAIWTWRVGRITIRRSLSLTRGRNQASIEYSIEGPSGPATLRAWPLTPLRDFHELESGQSQAPEVELEEEKTLLVSRGDLGLQLKASRGRWEVQGQWWYNFAYTEDRDRGQIWHEDIFAPAQLEADFPRSSASGVRKLSIQVELIEPPIKVRVPPLDGPSAGADDTISVLTLAADQFVVRRFVDEAWCASVLAGYPWFADWGRDTMIALPGLLLATGRVAEARTALQAFARHVQKGLIPNCFDDYGGAAHYNSVDAALWFVHAVGQYLEIAGSKGSSVLMDASRQIVEAYRIGTDFGIRADEDGLIEAGDESTQLTWMDAKRDNIAFTPRFGKPVEINALWHNALLALAKMTGRAEEQNELLRLAEQVADSFRRKFWWEERSCLHDVLTPGEDGFHGDCRLRPNQIFAVSLPHSPLSPEQQKSVVNVVRERLLTPFGLRTLDPDDEQYRGRYEGDMFSRDSAYHQGTVWPWPIGAYCEAVLRVGDFSDEARNEVRQTLEPLIGELKRGCVGQLAEVYDGDPPHRASGCPAQAWSIAEVLRVLLMLEGS